MTWIERISVPEGHTAKGTGSFRGAIFYIKDHEYISGRRVQDHEFPFRQRNYAEDLGKKTDKYRITAFLVGPNYDLSLIHI